MRDLMTRFLSLFTKSACTHGTADAWGGASIPRSPAQHIPPCGEPRNAAEEIRNARAAEAFEEQCNYPDLASWVRYGGGQ